MMLPWFFRSWGHGHWCNHSMAEPWYCEPAHKIKFPISSHKHIQYQDFMCHMSPLWPHTFSFRPHHLTGLAEWYRISRKQNVTSQSRFNCHISQKALVIRHVCQKSFRSYSESDGATGCGTMFPLVALAKTSSSEAGTGKRRNPLIVNRTSPLPHGKDAGRVAFGE